jgi:hypothetical protein
MNAGAFPYSLIWYALSGAAGAFVSLVVLLMLEKKVSLLEHISLPVWVLVVFYVLCGGMVAVVANIASSPTFAAAQIPVGFAAGFSWPAVVAGLTAGKRINDLDDQTQKKVGMLTKNADLEKQRMQSFYEAKAAEAAAAAATAKDAAAAAGKGKVPT